MKIELELEALQNTLEMVSKLAPPTSGSLTFSSNGNRLTAISSSDLSRIKTVLPCKVEGEGEFAIPIQALKDAVKGRAKLSLEYRNAVLSVQSGRYKADLATVDVIPLDELDTEESKDWTLGVEQANWLKKALRDVSLRPTSLLSTWMPAGIKITPKSGFVACYDTQHMSWTSTKEISGEFECVMPIETMINIVDVFGKAQFTICQMRNRVEVKTKLTSVILNLPTTDELPPLQDVQNKIKEASKIEGKTFQFKKEMISTFMDNAKAVIGKERAELIVEKNDKGIEASIRTGQGQVKAQIAGKGEGQFKIDYEYFSESLSKCEEVVTINVVEDAFMSMKLKNNSVIIALNQ
jgi:DNA polymerase III sliding clamp (beta) subunit (PCNA family)